MICNGDFECDFLREHFYFLVWSSSDFYLDGFGDGRFCEKDEVSTATGTGKFVSQKHWEIFVTVVDGFIDAGRSHIGKHLDLGFK